MDLPPFLSKQDVRDAARYAWGGRWLVALSRKTGYSVDELEGQYADGSIVRDAIIDVIRAALRERRDGCQELLESLAD